MKSVLDYPAFAETARLLSDLTNERDSLLIEQSGLRKQLAYNSNLQLESLTTEEAARRLADGGDIPKNAGDQRRAIGERELIVRERIEALNKVLADLPQLLEFRRQQARAAALAQMSTDVDKIKADFERAKQAMVGVMLAENALIDRLIVGGFGGGDAVLTAPHYLNRQRMIEVAANV